MYNFTSPFFFYPLILKKKKNIEKFDKDNLPSKAPYFKATIEYKNVVDGEQENKFFPFLYSGKPMHESIHMFLTGRIYPFDKIFVLETVLQFTDSKCHVHHMG